MIYAAPTELRFHFGRLATKMSRLRRWSASETFSRTDVLTRVLRGEQLIWKIFRVPPYSFQHCVMLLTEPYMLLSAAAWFQNEIVGCIALHWLRFLTCTRSVQRVKAKLFRPRQILLPTF